jgi:hypothetical protein
MGSKSEMAWRTAARLAVLAQEADDDAERDRMRDAWVTQVSSKRQVRSADGADCEAPLGVRPLPRGHLCAVQSSVCARTTSASFVRATSAAAHSATGLFASELLSNALIGRSGSG